jgi:uncharacterized OB-fold protein
MEVSRHWRLRQQRYSLVGEICPECNIKIFPPRDICPDCGHEAKETFQLSGRGEVYSFTTVYDPPAGHEAQAPYTVAVIQLEEGPRVTAQLTDLGDQRPEIGMQVEMVTRKLGEDGERGMLVYAYKFRPLLERHEGSIIRERG